MRALALVILLACFLTFSHGQRENDDDLSTPSRPNPLLHPNLLGRAVHSGRLGSEFAKLERGSRAAPLHPDLANTELRPEKLRKATISPQDRKPGVGRGRHMKE
jgi:hypothetical protein